MDIHLWPPHMTLGGKTDWSQWNREPTRVWSFRFTTHGFQQDNTLLFFDFAWACHQTHSLLENNTEGHAWTWAGNFFNLWQMKGVCDQRRHKQRGKRLHSLRHSPCMALFFPPALTVLGCTMWFFYKTKQRRYNSTWVFLLYINDTV